MSHPATTKPTILLVHGSYHPPKLYAPLTNGLKARGFEVHCPFLPTSDPNFLVADPSNPSFDQPPPPAGLPTQPQDVEVLSGELERLIDDEGKDVLMLVYSSAGWSASEAAVPRYQREQRVKEGKKDGVIGMFYFAAYLPWLGQDITELFMESMERSDLSNTWVDFVPERGLTVITAKALEWFLNVDRTEAEEVKKALTATVLMTSKLTNEPYSVLPCAYMIYENDRVVLPWYQEKKIKAVEEKSGKKFDVYKCLGGHDSFLSHADLYVDSIEQFAGKCA